jgi:lysophospholipase L1-like esterase
MPAPPLTTPEERERFVRYTRTNRWPLLERFPVPEDLQNELLASMTASSAEFVRETIAAMAAAVRSDALTLMADPAYRAAMETLPLMDGDRLVAIGDSVTADRLGWFELLKASLDVAGRVGVEVVNLGLSGDTTADVLERLDVVETACPTWVLVMLGTNDTRYHGPKQGYRMVSLGETERNLQALVEFVTDDLSADITLLTPPPGDQQRISSFFHEARVTWRAAELDAAATLIRKLDPACVDVNESMRATDNDLLEADGVHPTAAGQRHIAAFVVEQLSQLRRAGVAARSGAEPTRSTRVRTEAEA